MTPLLRQWLPSNRHLFDNKMSDLDLEESRESCAIIDSDSDVKDFLDDVIKAARLRNVPITRKNENFAQDDVTKLLAGNCNIDKVMTSTNDDVII